MPNALLSVPHFEQSRDGACLPACARMVLAYWGQSVTESRLARILNTKTFGTPISNTTRLIRLGFVVEHYSLELDQLYAYLSTGIPVIARVWTGLLTYWTVPTSHVVVVVGIDDANVYVNDPSFAVHPQCVALNSFLAAWGEYDATAVIVYPMHILNASRPGVGLE